MSAKLKVLELFSGIGGMHFACKEAERLSNHAFSLEVVTAIDINTSANSVYKHNFPRTNLRGRNIQSFSIEEINAMSPDVILMSPPCQPFTRTGLQKDIADARCTALSYLIETIPAIPSLQYLLLENVKGFEGSRSRDLITSMLTRAGFRFQEFLLSPTQFGVPNSRMRYYLIAKRTPAAHSSEASFCFETSSELMTELPKLKSNTCNPLHSHMTLHSILDSTHPSDDLYRRYLVSDKDLLRRFHVFDIVNGKASSTNCFTKAYTHYAEGTGSVLSNLGDMTQIEEIIEKCKHLKQQIDNSSTDETKAKKIKLDVEDTETQFGDEGEREILDEMVKDAQNRVDLEKKTLDEKLNTLNQDDLVEKELLNENVNDTLNKANSKDITTDVTGTNQNEAKSKQVTDIARTNESEAKREDIVPNVTGANQRDGSVTALGTNENAGNSVTTTRTNQNEGNSVNTLLANQNEATLLQELKRLNLRYFSPGEIRKLMCFPDECRFPPDCSDKARYKLLGNSINVHVVAYCICLMLCEPAPMV
ncbi:hypothetical protein M8J75_001164 [Diaphorina citri]|nr:hypothetical protein M8J75_001164 [Diaphorina citri]